MKNSVSVAPRSTERLSDSNSAARRRALLASLLAGVSLNLAACDGESQGTVNTGGSGGAADAASVGGSGRTGGLEGGVDAADESGADAEGGLVDPCEGLIAPGGLAEITLKHGETGSVFINFPSDKSDSRFNGGGIEIVDGDILKNSEQVGEARYIVRSLLLVYGNPPDGYSMIEEDGKQINYEVSAVPAEKQMIDDGQGIGNCIPNELEMRGNIELNKRMRVYAPAGTYATTAYRDQGLSFYKPGEDTQLTSDGTVAKVDRLGELVYFDSPPAVNAQTTVDQNNYVMVDLTGTTDEGESADFIYEGMTLEVDGYGFTQVAGSPHLWKSDQPFAPGQYTLNATVTGLNKLDSDKTAVQLNVDVIQ